MQQPFFLYIEDDAASREVMGILLKELMGFEKLAMFENSEAIIERLETLPERPDVIFLDIHVKPYNGHRVFEMLQGSDKYKQTLLIALTASVMSNEVSYLRQTGFRQLISKPINPLTFPEKLTAILAGQEIWDAGCD